MGERIAIHANPSLTHQVDIANALCKGIGGKVTYSPDTQADIHVVLGPWFALNQWRFSNTLYIDRAYWGDPDHVSVHWLQNGEKVRTKNNPYRWHPNLKPMKKGTRRLYLCDYACNPDGEYETVRYHPAQISPSRPLIDDLNCHDIAIGRRTTALVDAAIHGLQIETSDPNSPVYGITDREQWACDLAWHNWSLNEIESGAMWNALGNGY